MASQILNSSSDPTVRTGPSISVASTPLRLATKGYRPQKMAPAPKPKARKRTYRKRNRARSSESQAEKSISQLVSRGLGD
ncbi:MAG: hypothetical protein ACAH95_11815 [Fimbriimonas sp.]